MTASSTASTAGYSETADALIPQYESLSFEEVHGAILSWYPAAPAQVLDIGAGTGRDAAALARMGHRVTAVEPTAELRAYGEQAHAGLGIAWIDDGLPQLPVLRARGQRFDLILLTAVWMHLDAQERRDGMAALATLLAPGGRISFSLRHGPVPEGRRMFDVSAAALAAEAAPHGLASVCVVETPGLFGRQDVSWTRVVLQGP
ncbi:MAG: class I SAM-dependent methyltransferase [Comamonadaceae bacterium]|nr:MAG: class I SAM-dependent methyltransferase [Comamonadaceae bacterium]